MERGRKKKRETLKKRKGFFFLLIISFTLIVVVTISLNRVNRVRIKNEFKDLAIASGEAAKTYKMEILKESIETNAHNYTRFVIITRGRKQKTENPDKASLVFLALDKPGSLFLALKILADTGLNMKKLESRPIHGKPWEYMFYIDVEVPEDISIFRKAVEKLKVETEDLRILGVYKASNF